MSELTPSLLQPLYIAVLLAILIIDVQRRRVLNALALPATAVALLAGWLNGREPFLLALSGALLGFLLFYALCRLGRSLYGPAALGFGDAKLALLIGAMVGLQNVVPALALGMLLAGFGSLALLFSRRSGWRSTIPYGAFLAAGGIITLLTPRLPLA